MKPLHLFSSLLFSFPLHSGNFHEIALEQELFRQYQTNKSSNWYEYLNAKLAQLPHESTDCYTDTNLLFNNFPTLYGKIPYISLGNLPTPLEKLHAISAKTGIEVYIKQDGLSGGFDAQGKQLYGGNKIRKLEFLLAQARQLGARKVMTFGCAGSNHAVATAVHAHRLGMQPICMLLHQPPSHAVQHNLLMHLDYESELHFNASNEIRQLNTLLVWLEHYKRDGKAPYIIPTGGSNVFGTLGFVNAAFELAEQIKQGIIPTPSHIYVACGSCGTVAGLLLGCMAAGVKTKIVAIAVEPAALDYFAQKIANLFHETNALLHGLDNSFPLLEYTDEHLTIDLHFTGPRYGEFSSEGVRAYHELLEREHIKLDGTYTAKAFAGMLDRLQKEAHTSVLFWNTYCDLNNTKISESDYSRLPQCLHDYFNEAHIQPLDQTEIV